MRFEIPQVHELKHGGMRRFKIDGRGAAALQSGFPTRDADTPAVAGFQSGKTPLGHGRHEIVPVKHREIEKLLCHFHANRMQTDVLRACAAVSIAIKSGHRLAATAAQLSPQHVRWHARMIAHPGCEVRCHLDRLPEFGSACR